MAQAFDLKISGMTEFRRKIRLLADAGKLATAFKKGVFLTEEEARKRLDRHIAKAMGVQLQNVKGLTPIFLRILRPEQAKVTGVMGMGKKTGFNLSIYKTKVMKRRGRMTGVRVFGGKNNPYAGPKEGAFLHPGHWKVSKYVYTDELVARRDQSGNIEYLETDDPETMLNKAGVMPGFTDYVKTRLAANLKRHVRNQYRLLAMANNG